MFFAFIGFDIVATAAEETKKPQRDIPIGILASLGICTTLYVAVSLVVTGMVKYTDIKIDAPLAEAFRSVGKPGFATIISIGALIRWRLAGSPAQSPTPLRRRPTTLRGS